MISELAGADFMINSVESKMLWWHFNSDSTDLKAMEPGSCGQAHKLHDNVDPTQRGDLLFIFKSLGYLGIDWFHHAGIDVVIALRGRAEQCGWYEWVEGAFEPFCGPAFLKPQKSAFNSHCSPENEAPWDGQFYSKRTSKIHTTWAHEWETRTGPECLLCSQHWPTVVAGMGLWFLWTERLPLLFCTCKDYRVHLEYSGSKSYSTHHSEELPMVKDGMSLETVLSSLCGVLCYSTVSLVKWGLAQAF